MTQNYSRPVPDAPEDQFEHLVAFQPDPGFPFPADPFRTTSRWEAVKEYEKRTILLRHPNVAVLWGRKKKTDSKWTVVMNSADLRDARLGKN